MHWKYQLNVHLIYFPYCYNILTNIYILNLVSSFNFPRLPFQLITVLHKFVKPAGFACLFCEIFYSLTIFTYRLLFLLIVHYSPHVPFRLKSVALLLLVGNELHGLGVPCVEAMCCVTT